MVDCVLTGLSGDAASEHVAPPPPLHLPKCGVWVQLVRDVTLAAIEWHWSEDLAVSGLRCLLACLRCLRAAGSPPPPTLADRESAVVQLVCKLAVERLGQLSVAGKRVLLLSVNQLIANGIGQESIGAIVDAFFGSDTGRLINLALIDDMAHAGIMYYVRNHISFIWAY